MPAGHTPGWAARLIRGTNRLEEGLLVALVAVMVAVAGAQIVLRNLFGGGLPWADPLLRVLVLWVGLVGAMVATQRYKHVSIDVVMRFLPVRWQQATRAVIDLFSFAVCATIAFYAGAFVAAERAAGTLAFGGVPSWICALVIPFAFGAIAVRYLGFAWSHGREWLAARAR
jgi:TRAP-type C4-dicarboxylate transport system permease small subunit